MIIIKNILT